MGVRVRLDALAVPRDIQCNLLREGTCREATVPYISLAQDNDRLAEPPSGAQLEHALARAEVLRGKHDHESRCLMDLLLDAGVISSVQYARL